jgi:hypothetical protein
MLVFEATTKGHYMYSLARALHVVEAFVPTGWSLSSVTIDCCCPSSCGIIE